MFAENKLNAIYNLKGKFFRSFLVVAAEYISSVIFILSLLSSIYLLLIDTSFLEELGVFANEVSLIAICLFAVIENFMLLYIYIYAKLYSKNYFTFSENVKITFTHICKAIILYCSLFFRKICLFVAFRIPAFLLLLLTVFVLKKGISMAFFYVLFVALCIIYITSLMSYKIVIQKYYFVDVMVCSEEKMSLRSIFKASSALMEGKCRKMLLLKIVNIPKRILSFAILPAIYCLPLCRATEADLALMKEIPYMRRKAHTEKAVVFYFEPIKEN